MWVRILRGELKLNYMSKETLRLAAEAVIETINAIDKQVRASHLENEQWFLDWQDKLNEISVK